MYQLPEYEVRAWHFNKSVLEISADVVQVDREMIDRSLAISVPDLLETEANLYFSNVSGFNNVSMRGFGEGSGLRSLILVDGQPLNPADMGRINWEQIPLDSIESIEVLRGGHNVLYGDKALAGVIKIETRHTGDNRLNLEGRVGEYGFRQGSASGGVGGKAWGAAGGVFRQVFDGYRENSETEVSNAYVTAGRYFDSGDEVDFRLAVGESDLTYPGGLNEETYRDDPQESTSSGNEGSENDYVTFSGRARGERSWGSWELLAGFDQNDSEWILGTDSFGDNEQAGFSLKPRVKFDFSPLATIVGADFLYDELDFTRHLDEARNLVLSEAELSESRVSPYVFVEYELTDRLTVSGGVRYETVRYKANNVAYDEDQVENQFNPFINTSRGPRPNPSFGQPPDIIPEQTYDETVNEDGYAAEISLNYRLTEDLSIWAGYDRAYRYPVFDERAAYQGFPLFENVARDLEAEEGDQYELGLKWLNDSHELYATVFLLQMENEIIFDPTPGVNDPTSIGNGLNRNLGAVDRYGGDLSYYFRQENWGLSVAIAYVETEMKDGVNRTDGVDVVTVGAGKEVPLVPTFVTTSQLWWQPWEILRLRVVHRFVDERYQGGDFSNAEPRVGSYQLVDAQAEVQVREHCRVFAKLDNVFDERYAESVFAGSYYPGNGRFWQVGVKVDF